MCVDQRSIPGLQSGFVNPADGQRRHAAMRLVALSVAALALAAAGCSADITRFDQPSFALNDSSSSVTSIGSNGRRSSAGAAFDEISAAPPVAPAAPAGVQVAALPVSAAPPPPAVRAPRAATVPAQTAPVAARPAISGDVEVQQGDSLYSIAKRHHVLISELMAANDLKNPNIKPGQKLHLPSQAKGTAVPRAQPAATAATPAAPALTRTASIAPMAPAAAHPASASPEWTGSYTVKPGDNLYGIASHHGVKSDEIQRINGITDVRKIKPGVVLKVPGDATTAAAPPVAVAPIKIAARTPDPIVDSAPPASRDFKIINGVSNPAPAAAATQQVATAEPAEPVGLAAARAVSTKMRWPVHGRVVQGFGPRPDGSQNDGVDVAVPVGTEVLAAEAGTIAYAGSEVKTYGNLVLIRHDNGLVTAYAYNEQILVQRGDRVKRGQAIAKAGKTGNVDQPQLHFEVRVGTKPVDPLPYLEKL